MAFRYQTTSPALLYQHCFNPKLNLLKFDRLVQYLRRDLILQTQAESMAFIVYVPRVMIAIINESRIRENFPTIVVLGYR